MTATCPSCESDVPLPGPVRENEIVECPHCRVELEVVTAEPVLLAVAPEIEEDWGE